jgi:Spy/CpxP family protein refolding chaperone
MGRRVLIVGLVISSAINLIAVFTLGFYWREALRRRRSPPPQAMMRGRERPFSQLQGRFKLSETQVDTIRKLDQCMESQVQPIRRQLFETRDKLMSLMSESSFDQARSDSLFRATTVLQDKLEEQVYENMLRIRSILTPEQRNQVSKLSREFMTGDLPPGQNPSPGFPLEPRPQPPSGAPGR